MVSLDFRMPPDGGYPASLADANYAIRWLKTRAASLRSRPDLVGVMGTSSGARLGSPRRQSCLVAAALEFQGALFRLPPVLEERVD